MRKNVIVLLTPIYPIGAMVPISFNSSGRYAQIRKVYKACVEHAKKNKVSWFTTLLASANNVETSISLWEDKLVRILPTHWLSYK